MSQRVVVIGIDPSSKKLAFVITKGGKQPRVVTRTLPDSPLDIKADWAERHARRIAAPYVKDGYRVVAFVEDPVVGRGGAHATIVQATVRGGILVGLRRAGVEKIHGVNNQRWKKAVVGNGGVGKPQIKKYVHDTWPTVYKMATGPNGGVDEDVCDAACINLHGQKVLKMEDRINKHREEED